MALPMHGEVGKETDMKDNDQKIIDQLNDLIQLDYDAVQAYDLALQHIADADAADDLELFKSDHERHIVELHAVVTVLGGVPKQLGRDLKGILIEGMTKLRSATGTTGALKAMRVNEKLTNKTYEKALQIQMPPVAHEIVIINRDDERRHLDAIEAHIARLGDEAEVEREEELQEDRDDVTGAHV